MNQKELRELLDAVYNRYTRREFADPDPVIFLYRYSNSLDMEIAGLVASSLAYGRVQQILKSVDSILAPMGPSPRRFIEDARDEDLRLLCKGFKHRFTTEKEMAGLLVGVKRVVDKYGSLGSVVERGFKESGDLVGAAAQLVELLLPTGDKSSLLPHPCRGSACKRLFIFLRWMVRRDQIDPGCWSGVSPSALLVPLDVHMHRIGRILGFTKRTSGDLRTAKEITTGFAAICPEDPVRYDFALTRFGIREDMDVKEFVAMLEERA
jgi:uncharacterized protein (TIGR02757 family)